MDGIELWSGDMRMERKGRNRKIGGKIYEMGTGIREKNARIHGKRRN